MSFLMALEENYLANQQARNFRNPKSAVQTEEEKNPLQRRGVLIQQPKFIEREGINLHQLPLLVARSRIHLRLDLIKILRLPPIKVLALMQPA